MRYVAAAVAPYASYLVETFVTLAVVCGLAVFFLWGAKRAGLGRGHGPIEVCGHVQLEPRRAIYLVRVVDTVYVLGAGEGGFVKLGEMPASSLPAASTVHGSSFREVFERVVSKRQSGP